MRDILAGFWSWHRRKFFLGEYLEQMCADGLNPDLAGMIAGAAFTRSMNRSKGAITNV